uniref:CD72 antigen n=1 Tax=Peromyscus maniculatus bairdii TaxID=230844 RepID=A0A8C8VVF2_PERMB
MADAITYADLRFVKVPLKNSISNHLGQDCEAYEDGELTYENVQVSPVPGGPSGLASPVLVDKADLQVSQQFQQATRIFEATNGSLQEQLRQKTSQLRQKEVDLQKSQTELTLSQGALQEKQKIHEATEQQLEACQSEGQRTKESLEREEQQRRDLNQKLINMQDTLKRFFTCSSDSCCPVGWLQEQKRCFYISYTPRRFEESQKYCTSLSSKLAVVREPEKYYYYYDVSMPYPHSEVGSTGEGRYVIESGVAVHICRVPRKPFNTWNIYQPECTELNPCICELEASGFPEITCTEMGKYGGRWYGDRAEVCASGQRENL